jgi:two-component system, OmpR family, KDP operon response regulator KdpE
LLDSNGICNDPGMPTSREGNAGVPLRILVVEDHPGLQALLRTILESDERLVVLDVVGSSAEASAHRLLDDVDVALVDVGLPDLGGIETMLELRARNPALGVVIMSGSAHESTEVDARAAGADDYLEKSSLQDDLVESILAVGSRRVTRVE